MNDILRSFIESDIFIVIAILGLTMAVILDQMQIIAKVRGAASSKIASGYHSAMKLLVINRVGAVFYFTSIAIIIEAKHGAAVVKTVIFSSLLLIGFFLYAGLFYYKRNGLIVVELKFSRLTLASIFANMCNLIGLTVPWLLGAYFMDYRLMLANTSFVVNSLYTLINVLYLERILAGAIDEYPHNVPEVAGDLVIGRLCAVCFCCIGIYFL